MNQQKTTDVPHKHTSLTTGLHNIFPTPYDVQKMKWRGNIAQSGIHRLFWPHLLVHPIIFQFSTGDALLTYFAPYLDILIHEQL